MSHTHSHIINLSTRILSTVELDLLGKGLNFVPSSSKPPNHKQGLPRLVRDYRLAFYFEDSIGEPVADLPPFKSKSTWQPPHADLTIETYLRDLPKKLDAIPHMELRPTVPHREWQALKSLAADNSIVINKADKGTCVVIQDTVDYIAEGERHLANQEIYQQVDGDPTQQLRSEINDYISAISRKGYLQKDMMDYLTLEEDVRTQKMYFLKKLHKNPTDVRPIVSGCGGPTEKLSAFVDYFLQPLVLQVPSYIRDSKSLIARLEKLKLDDAIQLVSIDVKSLYLHIPQDEGIHNAVSLLSAAEGMDRDLPFPPYIAGEMMGIILKHNVFEFNSNMYKQVSGTAMGTKMAPSFANLYMATLEREFLEAEPIKPVVWYRYIDDILCIWPGSREQLNAFLGRLDEHHPTLKFTHLISDSSVIFLDLNSTRAVGSNRGAH